MSELSKGVGGTVGGIRMPAATTSVPCTALIPFPCCTHMSPCINGYPHHLCVAAAVNPVHKCAICVIDAYSREAEERRKANFKKGYSKMQSVLKQALADDEEEEEEAFVVPQLRPNSKEGQG